MPVILVMPGMTLGRLGLVPLIMLLGLGIILVLVVQIDPNAGVGTTLLGMTPNDDRRFQCLWKSNARVRLMLEMLVVWNCLYGKESIRFN